MAKSVLLSRLVREVDLAIEARPIVRVLFSRIVRKTSSRGERFVVVRIPTQGDTRNLSALTRQLNDFRPTLEDTHVLFLDPMAEFQAAAPDWFVRFYQSGGHLSVEGNRILAAHIHRHAFSSQVNSPVVSEGGDLAPDRLDSKQ